MKIKHQLLAVSLLLLSLPWAGYQFIHEIKQALRHGQTQALQATSNAIAISLEDSARLLYPDKRRLNELVSNHNAPASIYADITESLQVIDGYFDSDNVKLNVPKIQQNKGFSFKYQLLQDNSNYYLLLAVKDPSPGYANPDPTRLDSGDRLVILAERQGKPHKYFFTASSPGAIYGRFIDGEQIKQDNALAGFWQQTVDGYTIELQLPKTQIGKRLGFYLQKQNAKDAASSQANFAGNITPENLNAPWITGPSKILQSRLAAFERPGLQIHVVDKQGWILASIGKPGKNTYNNTENSFWLMEKLYRYLLSDEQETALPLQAENGRLMRDEVEQSLEGKPSHRWYLMPGRNRLNLLSTVSPVTQQQQTIAAVVAEETSDQFMALTSSAFNRLIYLSFFTVAVTGIGLLAYASWLGWRIQKLSKAAKMAITDDGRIKNQFPKSTARDEIGELTRNYASLIKRLQEYTNYLRTLSSKLSHELRTPLAIVHSSLDNIENQIEGRSEDDKTRKYQQRAKEGANRLSRIITAMSEASRVEESIQHSDFKHFNPASLFRELIAAYSDTYTGRDIDFTNECPEQTTLYGSPDLLVQMLDKLVENANDFCPENGRIHISLRQKNDLLLLTVSNDGPLLPETMTHQLFDSMVSIRDKSSEKSHLGLGLFIVRLIVDAHYGSIHAANRNDNSGVDFIIELPVSIKT